MTDALTGIAELLTREAGIVVPAARHDALRAAAGRVMPGLDPGAALRALGDPGQRTLVDRLIDEVTVQETAFLRDRGQLDRIPWSGLRRGPGPVRAWSAGCATGEEAFSLALLAAEALAPGRPGAPPPADVLGTDVSAAAIAAACAGRYAERAVRNLDAARRRRWLQAQPGGTYLVAGQLRSLVRFRRHNLARDPFPPPGEAGFDLIVCRNVLIYFRRSLAERVTRRLELALRPGGTLVLGAADGLQRAAAGPAPGQSPPPRCLRRPLGRPAAAVRRQRLAAALDAAGRGDRSGALTQVTMLLADDPLDAEAHFVRGIVLLDAGQPAAAVTALRGVLYTDPTFALAAFTLGRAYDAAGDRRAGQRAYARALRALQASGPVSDRHEALLQQVDVGDIVAACRARLGGQP